MNQFFRTNAPLYVNYGTKINPEATAADLFGEVFYDPTSNPLDIRAQVMGVVDDDITLLIFAMQGADDPDVELWQRALHRIQSRIKIADALSLRFGVVEKQPEIAEAAE